MSSEKLASFELGSNKEVNSSPKYFYLWLHRNSYQMHIIYILSSIKNSEKYYIDTTQDLEKRLITEIL